MFRYSPNKGNIKFITIIKSISDVKAEDRYSYTQYNQNSDKIILF